MNVFEIENVINTHYENHLASIASNSIHQIPLARTRIQMPQTSSFSSIYSLFIINKAGSLIYHRDFPGSPNKSLTINEMLVIASSFQSILAISAQLVPNSSSLRVIEGNSFRLRCLETPTSTKFIISTNKATTEQVEMEFLHLIYRLYADFVMKNAFYTVEMPIKCHLFEVQVNKLMHL